MKKMMVCLTMIFFTASWAMYNVGDTVAPEDNLEWTIDGPAGHSEIGQTSDIYSKLNKGKVVFLFMGQDW